MYAGSADIERESNLIAYAVDRLLRMDCQDGMTLLAQNRLQFRYLFWSERAPSNELKCCCAMCTKYKHLAHESHGANPDFFRARRLSNDFCNDWCDAVEQ